MFIKHLVILSFIVGLTAAAHYQWTIAVTYLTLVPAFLLLPRWLYHRSKLKEKFNDTFLLEMEYMALLGVLLAALGESFIYKIVPAFDSLVHFINGILLTIFIVSINHEQWLDGRFSPTLTVLVAGLLPVIANEIYEFSADRLIGTNLWTDAFKPLWLDTISDVILQVCGSIIAVFILKKNFPTWLKKWQHRP